MGVASNMQHRLVVALLACMVVHVSSYPAAEPGFMDLFSHSHQGRQGKEIAGFQDSYAEPPVKDEYSVPAPKDDYSVPAPTPDYSVPPPPKDDYSVPPPTNDYGAPPPTHDYSAPCPPSNSYSSRLRSRRSIDILGFLANLFKPRQRRGKTSSHFKETPDDGYGVPQDGYGVPHDDYGVPKDEYGAPKPEYGVPESGYGSDIGSGLDINPRAGSR